MLCRNPKLFTPQPRTASATAPDRCNSFGGAAGIWKQLDHEGMLCDRSYAVSSRKSGRLYGPPFEEFWSCKRTIGREETRSEEVSRDLWVL